MASFDPKSYAEVKDRIPEFFAEHPEGSIRTFMVVQEGAEVIFEARIYRTLEEAEKGIYTSGFAREVEGKSPVNKTSHVENCETSAIGRALANLAYQANANRASREEMLMARRQEGEHDRMIEFITDHGRQVSEALLIEGSEQTVRDYIKANWKDAQERFLVARQMVEVIEKALGIEFDG